MEPHNVAEPPTLAELLRSIHEQRSTCVLWVSDGTTQGELTVEHGDVVASRFGELQGIPAIDALFSAGSSIRYQITSGYHDVSRAPEESMVVPRALWSQQAGLEHEPAAPEHALEELPPNAASEEHEQHSAIVVADAHEPAGEHAPSVHDTHSAPPALRLSEESVKRISAEPPGDGPSPRAQRVIIGSLIGLALLVAILIARTAEHQQARQKAPAASTATEQPAAAEAPKAPEAPSGTPEAQAAAVPTPAAQDQSPVVLPKLEAGEAPVAPAGALAATIPVRVLVGADGYVKKAELVSRRDGFAAVEDKALEAAHSYRFQAPQQDGKPVEAWLTLPVRFRPTPPTVGVTVKGSDTIGATLMPAWTEALRGERPQLSVQVEGLGSTTGLAALLDGSADIAASSRLIRADELALAEKLGIQLREVYAGYDGVSLIVNPSNPTQSLDLETVARIFAGRISNWSELGGPSAPIRVLGRPGYSGTHRFVKERVLSRLGPDTNFGGQVASIEKTSEIVDAVAKDANAIGYVSSGLLRSDVRALGLAPASGASPLQPTAATIRDGSYPLARPLLLYLRPDSGRAAHELVDFALSDPGQAVVEKQGFVPLPPGLSAGLVSQGVASAATPRPEVIRIYFEPNIAVIARDSQPDLLAAASAVRPHRSIVVVGNTDSSGDPAYNRLLAQQRVDVVAARLRELGSREAKISVEVAAADHPVASNETSDGRRANRRVDVIVQPWPAPGR